MDMTPALGSVYKGEITEFPDVRGYVLFEKPDKIRIIGLDPVIRTKAFDMVSVGSEFKLLLPSKNRFIVGRNDAPANSKNKMENLRPDAFLHAILIYPPNNETELPLLEDDTDEEHSFYILLILSRQNDQLTLARAIYFDRLTLNIVRQKGFDRDGSTVSDTRYSDWKTYNNVAFPDTIDINRPLDGYGVVMKTVKVVINGEIKPEQFELNQPDNTKLQVIGEPTPPPGPSK